MGEPRAAFGCLVVGGGPAALAPLVAASREGSLDALLSTGVAVVEKGEAIGAGRIGNYAISSDSTADSLLTAVKDHGDSRLSALWGSDLCRRFRDVGGGSVSLADAGRLQSAIGDVLSAAIRGAGGSLFLRHRAISTTRTGTGWRTKLRRLSDDLIFEVDSRSVILGMGGDQPADQLTAECVAGAPLLPLHAGKVIQSDAVLQRSGLATVLSLLRRRAAPKVAIVGGSTSAMAVADLLLRSAPKMWQPGALTLLHRRPLRVFFPSVAAAWAAQYNDFGPEDVCPVTGFVYRLAGLRQHSRDLLMSVLGVGAPIAETRLLLHRLQPGGEAAAQTVLAEADLIVAALGYRPRTVPVFSTDGRAVPLLGEQRGGRLVDEQSRVLTQSGEPLDGLFGIGLSAGFKVGGAMGGEPSFVGQSNGLWLWQNDIGLAIARQVLVRAADVASERHAPRSAAVRGAAAPGAGMMDNVLADLVMAL